MDIRKLVNQGQARHDDAREWSTHQTLPPFSAMFPDPSYAAATGYHYPLPPQGEGGYSAAPAYSQYAAYHQPQAQQPQQVFLSQQFSSSSKFAPAPSSSSVSRGPETSAERRSLSAPSSSSNSEDSEDDDMSDGAASSGSGGSNTPLPPYQAQAPQHHQQVFIDTSSSSSSPQTSSPSSPSADGSDYVCEDCGVSYSRAPDLRRHKASVHGDRASGEKVAATFPCEVCGQVLLSSHGYQGHMRRHYDERPFVCEAPYCGKAFHDSATLARHRRTHSTEHKFECDFCGRRFKRKDNLNTHRKKHQVGGESINPNLLRKPVTRVSSSSATQSENGGSSAGGSPGSTPQIPSYGELPLASPPYQSLPPQPAVPQYTHIDQHAHHHHHQQQQQQQAPHFHLHQSQYPPQMYPAPPYYPQFQQPAPQQQPVQGIYGRPAGFSMGAVKAEEMDMEFRNRMRMTHLPPAAR